MRKNPKYDLKLKYRKALQLSMVLALALLIGMFQVSKKFEKRDVEQQEILISIDVQEIPQTEQQERPPAPKRPAVPIESESEDIPEDETIETTELSFDDLPEPPEPPKEVDETAQIFYAFDKRPEPIGGMAAIQRNLIYPEMARKAGVEGTVLVQAIIDEKGNVVTTTVIKSLGNNGCDEAAQAAIKKVKWKPAMQRDKPVRVQIAIPVIFKLRNN
jgi:protein TonB